MSQTNPVPTHPRSQNRRLAGRLRLEIPAVLVNEQSGGGEVAATIIELSKSGVGLQAKLGLEPGSLHQVRAFDSLIAADLRVRIISSRAEPTGGFLIGAEVA